MIHSSRIGIQWALSNPNLYNQQNQKKKKKEAELDIIKTGFWELISYVCRLVTKQNKTKKKSVCTYNDYISQKSLIEWLYH